MFDRRWLVTCRHLLKGSERLLKMFLFRPFKISSFSSRTSPLTGFACRDFLNDSSLDLVWSVAALQGPVVQKPVSLNLG